MKNIERLLLFFVVGAAATLNPTTEWWVDQRLTSLTEITNRDSEETQRAKEFLKQIFINARAIREEVGNIIRKENKTDDDIVAIQEGLEKIENMRISAHEAARQLRHVAVQANSYSR